MPTETFYYARVAFPYPGVPEYVRFTRKANRAFWVAQDVASRFPVYKPEERQRKHPILVDRKHLALILAEGVTWSYIDGVSYANLPKSE